MTFIIHAECIFALKDVRRGQWNGKKKTKTQGLEMRFLKAELILTQVRETLQKMQGANAMLIHVHLTCVYIEKQ